MNTKFRIGNFDFNDSEGVFIIAELSANHNGSLENALNSIKAAKRAGANAIKLQTYTADTITINCKSDDFRLSGNIWEGKYLYELYQEAFTPWEWHPILFEAAKNEGLICFSSPFDRDAVDFLESLDAPAYKIASFEITDIPLIEYVANKGKPVIISTGIADKADIELAISACKSVGNDQIILLKCTSGYPTKVEETNLLMIQELKKDFDVITGLSDHTLGITAPVTATALGARVIEKHFILNRSIGGPDASFSLDENEFRLMVEKVRETEKMLGSVTYYMTEAQLKSRKLCRSLYVVKDIKTGQMLTPENIRSIRPGYGLHPRFYNAVLGKKANRDLQFGTALSLDDIY
jgi:pseudaminic acid synthase